MSHKKKGITTNRREASDNGLHGGFCLFPIVNNGDAALYLCALPMAKTVLSVVVMRRLRNNEDDVAKFD
jgi:hypothetical protein